MAETKNSALSKFDKDALKEWFTLAEVAVRWTSLTGQNFAESDLLELGASGKLALCFFFMETAIAWDDAPRSIHMVYSDEYDEELHGETDLKDLMREGILQSVESNPGTKFPATVEPGHFRLGPYSVSEIIRYGKTSPGSVYESKFLENGELINEGEVFGHIERNEDSGQQETITAEWLVISRKELDRFEKEHGISSEVPEIANKPESEIAPKGWKPIARQIAENIDPKHTAAHMGALAMEIHEELKKQGVRSRVGRTPEVVTIEREILRGWSAKS